jgi:hypothetical protein
MSRIANEGLMMAYGATEPDARLTVQGEPVALRPDGTFSLHFALPDGTQVIPVRAESADGGAVHLIGLVSDGGVHSHIDHLFALLEAAKARGAERVFIHAFLDGRDVPPESGAGFLDALGRRAAEIGVE